MALHLSTGKRLSGILFRILSREIELTQKGREKSEGIYERHTLLTEFLQRVSGVSAKVAEEDACKMEHIISDETFQGIKRFMNQP